MSAKRKTKTMYMHTLDGKPARLVRYTRGRYNYSYLSRITPRVRAPLFASAKELNAEWEQSLASFAMDLRRDQPQVSRAAYDEHIAVERKRYGYVLVEVPA